MTSQYDMALLYKESIKKKHKKEEKMATTEHKYHSSTILKHGHSVSVNFIEDV